MKEITVIIPVYNEIDNLSRIKEVFDDYIPKALLPMQVLFVDDGSTDGSLDIIKDICKENRYNYISFTHNRGLSTAIKAGIDNISTPIIGYIDADLQTTPYDFDKLLKYINDYDAVIGYRAKRADTLSKKLQSKIANYIRRSLIDDGIIDTGCPLKVFRSEIAKKIPFFDGMHRFIPALMLLEGAKIKQIPVNHYPRVAGVSKFNLFNRSLKPLQDIFAYRWMRSRYIRYEIRSSSL